MVYTNLCLDTNKSSESDVKVGGGLFCVLFNVAYLV